MNSFSKISLRTKIIGIVGLVVVMMGAASWYNMRQMFAAYEGTLFQSMENYAIMVGDRFSAQFFERYADVQAFANNGAIQSMDQKQMQGSLEYFVKAYGIYDVIMVVDASGNFVASNLKDSTDREVNQAKLRHKNYGDTAWFKAVMSGQTSDDPKQGFIGTYVEGFQIEPLFEAAFGDKKISTGFSSAIKDANGKIVGVLTNRAGSRWIENEILAVYEHLKEANFGNTEITVTGNDGAVLINHAPKANGGKNEIIHDFNDIFKRQFVEKGTELDTAVQASASGHAKEIDKMNGIEDIIGYSKIENPKWLSSLHWNIFVHGEVEEVEAAAATEMRNFYLIFGMNVFIVLAVAIWFSLVISKMIDNVIRDLSVNSSEVASASSKIAASATELSESATEQAAALQETVAAVDEISAMVEKNAEAANKSKEVSGFSREAAEKGQKIVEHMIGAIGEIDSSNNEISSQMDNSNQQLSEIIKLIGDISNKTKVINEIVFQTKLLSFNASVEAARAGEYGKGFAVVAEEVGNLAQMSGNAAKEITTMLDDSVHKVEAIVKETQSKVEKLMSMSKEKVKVGSATAQECNDALSDILNNVRSVDSLVSEIAVASAEQSTGIREISKAVGQMEQVTQQNSSVAQSSSVAAEHLHMQSESLDNSVGDLVRLVRGSSDGRPVVAPVAAKTTASAKPAKETKTAKVINMPKPAPKPAKAEVHETPVSKKASGSDVVPSFDDPGFEE